MQRHLICQATILNAIVLLVVSIICGNTFAADQIQAKKDSHAHPNIVIVLADDMGYGDPKCFNPQSQCETPHIDKLASEGMRFTDAHAAGALCVESRYGLLTGRYPFRQPLNWRKTKCIDADTLTLADVLKRADYTTAMVGKWHLGFEDGPDYDYANLKGGPRDCGFDYYYGMPASLDIPPYYYIEDRHAVQSPTETIAASATEGWSPIQGAFWREGKVSPDFKHDEVLDRFSDKACQYIESRQGLEQPFFLHVTLPAPHTPWLPAERFQGRGKAGLYGEFVAHVDDVVGRVAQSLEKAGKLENTIVIFTSDNGATWYDADEEQFGHDAGGGYRGMKADMWEGGHRVPFIVRWPGKVEAGSTSDQLIGFVDLWATFAMITGGEPQREATIQRRGGRDSVSFLPALRQYVDRSYCRVEMAQHHSGQVYREGDWKLIRHLGSGGFTKPSKVPREANGPAGQLYNLANDPAEQENLWQSRSGVVERLSEKLDRVRAD